MKHITKTKRQYLVYDKNNNLVGTWNDPKSLRNDLNFSTSSLIYNSIKNEKYVKNNIDEKKEYKIIRNKEKITFEIETKRKEHCDNSNYLKDIRTYLEELPEDAKLVYYCPSKDLYATPSGLFIGNDINGLYIITPYLNKYKGVQYGYYKFHYKNKVYRVHDVLGRLFVPGYKPGLCVDHINNDSTDNRIENLQWITRGANAEKWWNSLSDEKFAEYKEKYSNGLKKAHADGKYKKHLKELHEKKEGKE